MTDDNVYAILGRGYAAALDYATLRLTEYGLRRLGGRDVLFFGDPDPWQAFYSHEMGQAATLLSLPGFIRHPQGDHFLRSNEFAEITQEQYDLFAANPRVHLEPRSIIAIRLGQSGEIELHASDGDVIRAANVDICTGPGADDRDPFHIPEPARKELCRAERLLSGQRFLQKATAPPDGETVCIVGSGPVGALCCERALAHANQVLWVGIDGFFAAFPPGGRFDHLANYTRHEVVPRLPSLRIAHHCRSSFVRVDGGRPTIAFRATDGGAARSWDVASNWMDLSILSFDCLVLALGPTNGIDGLFDIPVWDLLEREALKVPVGLQAYDGNLRVLGAAALSHSHFKSAVGASTSPRIATLLQSYIGSLSNHVQVPESYPNLSVPVAARFIAEANYYFSENARLRGPNWNCAFGPNIERCMQAREFKPSTGQLPDLVDDLFERRKAAVLSTVPDFAPDHGGIVYSAHAPSDYEDSAAAAG